MKIRNGFVSNSSSSSFLALVIRDHRIINQIEKKLKPKKNTDSDVEKKEHDDWFDWYELAEGKNPVLENADYERYVIKGTGLTIFENDYNLDMVGIELEEIDLRTRSLDDIEKSLREELEDYGIKINMNTRFTLEYGSWGSG